MQTYSIYPCCVHANFQYYIRIYNDFLGINIGRIIDESVLRPYLLYIINQET